MSAKPLQVWIVDDDASIRWVLERALKNGGMLTKSFGGTFLALEALRIDIPDVLITDIRMTEQSGLELLKKIKRMRPLLPVIVMTAQSDLVNAISAFESGAFEYLPKPFDIDNAVDLVKRASQSSVRPYVKVEEPEIIPELLGKASAMQQVFRAIGRLSRSSVTVLITGESGTGKELVARALHQHSPRADKPLITFNTSAIPSELLESEIFGHEKGSFTGAEALRRGRFEQANGGTLFLDEIGDMPIALQTRLLRVLAEGEFYRVGGQTLIKVDVRVIAATHQNLEDRVTRGLFREDLFHRLNVIKVELPPLRSRREDVGNLLDHYLNIAAQELGIESKILASDARSALEAYAWPGNVRELVNLCRRLSVLAPGSQIHAEDLPFEIIGSSTEYNGDMWWVVMARWAETELFRLGAPPLLETAMPKFERTLIRIALQHTHGHRQEAAKLLGWGRNTLTRKFKELGIEDQLDDEATVV